MITYEQRSKNKIEAIRNNLTSKTMVHKLMQTKYNNTHEIMTTTKVPLLFTTMMAMNVYSYPCQ